LEADDVVEVRELSLMDTPQALTGSFDRVTLAIAHLVPNNRTTRIFYEATWSNTSAFRVEPIVYDDGQAETYALIDGSGAGFATRFSVPDGARLGTVSLPLYYLNEFGDDPPDTAPRDFILTIWDAATDGSPGTVLFSQPVTDPRATQDVFTDETTTRYLTVDVFEELMDISLPETIFVGAANDGDDDNFIVYSASRYAAENLSYQRNTSGSWTRTWDISFTDGSSLRNHIIPVRMELMVENEALATPGLSFPEPNAAYDTLPIDFSWSAVPEADSYEFLLASDSLFADILLRETGLDQPGFTLSEESFDLTPANTYYWRVAAVDGGRRVSSQIRSFTTPPPAGVVLAPNYPNPFQNTTEITFDLPAATDVRLTVYDLLGREVATLVDGSRSAGRHTVQMDARGWASGLYIYVLDTGTERQTRQMVLTK
jgi:hypothetical protein